MQQYYVITEAELEAFELAGSLLSRKATIEASYEIRKRKISGGNIESPNSGKSGQPCGEHNTGSPKLPPFDEVNEARLSCNDPMLENVTKKQLRAVYDLIERQPRAGA